MQVIPFILISVIAIIYFIYKRKNKRSDELFAKLPSPPSWPIIGNIWYLLDPSERVSVIHKSLLENEGVVAFHGLWMKYVFVSDVEIIRKLCTSNNVKKYGRVYKLFENWIGINVFNAEDELWKKYRSVLTPLLHFETIEQYIPVATSTSCTLIHNMKSSTGKQINVYEYVELWSINTFLGMALKVSFATENLDWHYAQNLRKITKIIALRLTNPFKCNDLLFSFTRDYQVQKKTLSFLKNEAKQVLKQVAMTQVEDDKKASGKTSTFLDLIQDKSSGLNEEEICNHLQGLLFVGYDTTPAAVSCVLYLLSIHQDVQEKLFQEIESICGKDKTKHCTSSDLQKMPYLEMVIKESLRLHPPVPFISKYTLEEFRSGDYLIPRDSEVIISIGSLHRNPEYFPNPDVFDPERFSAKNIRKIKTFSYIPFSAGLRNCLAQRVAMLAMKILLSMIIRYYKLLPADEFKLRLFHYVMLKPGDEGVQLKLQSRED